MNWIKLGKWKSTEKQILKSGEKVIGTYKSFDNLNFVTIYQAGHMVPTD
jgi:carboxypeptidase C (cathepsin A)